LKGLEDIICKILLIRNREIALSSSKAATIVSPRMGIKDQGWPFASIDDYPGAEVDPLYNSEHIKDLYLKADPDYSARFVERRSSDLVDVIAGVSYQVQCSGLVGQGRPYNR
jgi:hypothetical protein